jgi:signal peptidase I
MRVPLADPQAIAQILRLLVGILVCALMLRTWLVLGLIEPVTVAGSSMAPTLRGPHIGVACERCGNRFDIGAENLTSDVECLGCGYTENSVEGLPVDRGDFLVINRMAFAGRMPRRWEPVVFRSPDDGELTVKRVVGLPGETIQLRGGDVLVDGQVVTKSLAELRALRQVIHVESRDARRWRASDENACGWHSGSWQITARDGAECELVYEHLAGAAITNDSAYNGGLSRRVFPVRDFGLSVKIGSPGDWQMTLGFDNGGDPLFWNIEDTGDRLLEVFAFDRRVQIFLDGRSIAESALDAEAVIKPTARPFSLSVLQSHVELRELTIYGDIYHASEAEQIGSPVPMRPVKLCPAEIYVLGDNEAVSLDSRRWGPVLLRLLVGKPVGVR